MATDQPTWAQPRPAEQQHGQPQEPGVPPRLPHQGSAAAVRLVGVLVVLGLIALGAASTVVQFFRQEAVETMPLSAGTSRVVATTDTGDIRVRAAVGSEIPRLTSTLHWSFDRPTVQRNVTSDTEQLDARCPGHWVASDCSVDLDLVLPAGTTLKIDSDTGDVRINGIAADLEATTATGNVQLSAVSGANVAARTDTGDITVLATAADGTVKADTGTGDVRITMTAAPRSVHAKADTGDVTITVPPGTGYAVSGSTDVGERTVSIATDPASDRSISAQTSVGDVRLLAAGQ